MKKAFGVDEQTFAVLFHRNEFQLALSLLQKIEGQNEDSIASLIQTCERLAAIIEEDSTPTPRLRLVK